MDLGDRRGKGCDHPDSGTGGRTDRPEHRAGFRPVHGGIDCVHGHIQAFGYLTERTTERIPEFRESIREELPGPHDFAKPFLYIVNCLSQLFRIATSLKYAFQTFGDLLVCRAQLVCGFLVLLERIRDIF